MSATIVQARKLLNAAELELYVASRGKPLSTLTAMQLRAKVKRARTMRDKAHDLLRRQKLSTRERTRSKGGRSGAANARSADKARLVAEMLQRFEMRLAQTKARAKQSSRPLRTVAGTQAARRSPAGVPQKSVPAEPPRSPKAPAKRPPAQGPRAGSGSESARAARHAMQPKVAGQTRVHAHLASRGRRQ